MGGMGGIMRKIKMIIELTYDAEMMHGNDPEAIEWFEKEILGGELILHSNELGDEVGKVRITDDDYLM